VLQKPAAEKLEAKVTLDKVVVANGDSDP